MNQVCIVRISRDLLLAPTQCACVSLHPQSFNQARHELNSSHSDYWSVHDKTAQRTGLQGWGKSLMDNRIERVAKHYSRDRILEVGSSSGEDFEFASKDGLAKESVCVAMDMTPGQTDPFVAAELANSSQVTFVGGGVQSLQFSDESFDHVISICLFAHVLEAERALEEARCVVGRGGTIVVGLPTDPGLANRTIKRLVTYRSMRRAGVLDPRLRYAREHRNGISNLLALIRHVFREDHVREHFFQFPIPSWNLNLAVTVEVMRR